VCLPLIINLKVLMKQAAFVAVEETPSRRDFNKSFVPKALAADQGEVPGVSLRGSSSKLQRPMSQKQEQQPHAVMPINIVNTIDFEQP